jgi:cofilin
VNPDCLAAFQELKLGKKYKYIVFALNQDNTEIIVAKKSDSKDYDEFVGDLPEAECRYAVYDFEYEKEGAGKRNKICFVSWYVQHYLGIDPARSG